MKATWQRGVSVYPGITIYTLDLRAIWCRIENTWEELDSYSIIVYIGSEHLKLRDRFTLEYAKKAAEKECRKQLRCALEKLDGVTEGQ